MCSIFGFIRSSGATPADIWRIEKELQYISDKSRVRGKDAWGCAAIYNNKFTVTKTLSAGIIPALDGVSMVIGSCRAEPTTEWVKEKTEEHAHPFCSTRYAVVHNGVVANDKEFGIKTKTGIDSEVIPWVLSQYGFPEAFEHMIGSFACLIIDRQDNLFHGYRDYKPLVAKKVSGGLLFASKKEFFDGEEGLIDIPPYTFFTVNPHTLAMDFDEVPRLPDSGKAFVVCSGGLDSTTVAKIACEAHGSNNVTLLHFKYGCRAQDPEITAVRRVAEFLDCHLRFVDLDFIKGLGGNALTDSSIPIADSIAGAEYAHEWVPFRNGVMISLTAALCDRFDVRHIYLGLNLEEGGAFPDNTEEFYEQFNRVLQLGSTSRPVIHNPLGSLMKHEIVKLALEIGAPIHLSWSCYRDGDTHCGMCAPCFMRRTAFKMNGKNDMIEYANG